MILFNEQTQWKLDEVERRLNHPRLPLQKWMKEHCNLDNLSKKYTLKAQYR